VAHRWNIPEQGRFAAWYRDLFGELPSETLALQHHRNVMGPRQWNRNLPASA
jgi:hypothetical protein